VQPHGGSSVPALLTRARARSPERPAVCFVHIQKTGGDSVRAALGLPEKPPDKHWTARELRASIGFAEWERRFSFAFVRNPWDRLVSWWSMIDAARPPSAELRAERTMGFWRYVLSNARCFEEFILNCTETIADPDGDKSIMRPQLDYISGDGAEILVNFVGRFETLDADFRVVTARLGREGLALPHANKSRHRRHYRHYYDQALAAVVGERFKADLTAFGYEF
jgi:hypothetical protein